VEEMRAKIALLRALPFRSLTVYNDTHTHAEVLAAFDAAIASERAKAGEV
jgi:hypothetical protein